MQMYTEPVREDGADRVLDESPNKRYAKVQGLIQVA
jgi:hypothetical protein